MILSELKKAVLDACSKGELIVINAGASAGSEDFTARVIRELGEVILHGVNIKPGKPVVLGIVDGKPVLGIPGYPVSAFITFNLFVKPIVYKVWAWISEDRKMLESKDLKAGCVPARPGRVHQGEDRKGR